MAICNVKSNCCDVDFELKLIIESAMELLSVQNVYCFSEYQAKEIVKRCNFICSIRKIDNGFYEVIRKESIRCKRRKLK